MKQYDSSCNVLQLDSSCLCLVADGKVKIEESVDKHRQEMCAARSDIVISCHEPDGCTMSESTSTVHLSTTKSLAAMGSDGSPVSGEKASSHFDSRLSNEHDVVAVDRKERMTPGKSEISLKRYCRRSETDAASLSESKVHEHLQRAQGVVTPQTPSSPGTAVSEFARRLQNSLLLLKIDGEFAASNPFLSRGLSELEVVFFTCKRRTTRKGSCCLVLNHLQVSKLFQL